MLTQFSRTELLLEAMNKLSVSKVAIFGMAAQKSSGAGY